MTKKIYSVEWNGVAEICIEVDHAKNTEKLLYDVNHFLRGSEDEPEQTHGNITEALLKRIAVECFRLIMIKDEGVNHLINNLVQTKGYPQMDGSDGIRLVHYDPIEFKPDDMTISIIGDNNDK